MNVTPVVKQLLIINVLLFLGCQFVGDYAYELLSLHYFESPSFKPWQLISHMFMHAQVYPSPPNPSSNLMHIVFNMMALYSFGSLLENIWGGKKFLFFYFSAGLGAALLQLGVYYYFVHSGINELSVLHLSTDQMNQLLNMDFRTAFDENGQLVAGTVKDFLTKAHCTQEQFSAIQIIAKTYYQSSMVGASGAIYGLLVAFAFLFPEARLSLMFIPVPIKAKYFVPLYMLLYDGFFGIFGSSFMGVGSNVAHYAHIGGALIGFVMMWYWKKNSFNNRRWD